MNRWLGGVFDPSGRAGHSSLSEAFASGAAKVAYGPMQVVSSGPMQVAFDESMQIASSGPMQVAYCGQEPPCDRPLCLLDGFLDNGAELSAALDAPRESAPEALLAAGWRHWGPRLPVHLRGDFAFLIWDPLSRTGLLARDQLGVRSLLLHERSGVLSFATELRHLLAILPSRPAPDPVSVAHWLATSDRPGDATVFAGVRRLRPGAMLLLNGDGFREETYWAPRFAEPLTEGRPQIVARLRAALGRAVSRRLSPGGPTGVLMSGGLDSASVAALAGTRAPGRVLACSGAFPEHPAADEHELIGELRSALGLQGILAEVRSGGLLANVLQATEAWGKPVAGWGGFWLMPLMRGAAQAGVEVILGGDGGDELFETRAQLLADRLRAGHPLEAIGLVKALPGAAYGAGRRDIAAVMLRTALVGALPLRLHLIGQRLSARPQAPRWLRPGARRDLLDSSDPLAWKRLDGPRWWSSVAHTLTSGLEEMGVFEHQRLTAASSGLHARHPLLDLDLVELGLRQPPLETFDASRSRPLLRAAMDGMLPDAVRLRPQKALFDPLLVDCLAGPDGAAVGTLLSDPKAHIGAYVDMRVLRRELLDDDRLRRAQPFAWMWRIWRLSTAECWLRIQAGADAEQLVNSLKASAPRVVVRSMACAAARPTSTVFPP